MIRHLGHTTCSKHAQYINSRTLRDKWNLFCFAAVILISLYSVGECIKGAKAPHCIISFFFCLYAFLISSYLPAPRSQGVPGAGRPHVAPMLLMNRQTSPLAIPPSERVYRNPTQLGSLQHNL